MANSHILSTSSLVPFSLTSSPTIRKSSANKLDYLYELSYVPDTNKISPESLPLINPYHTFTKTPHSLVRSIKTLIKPSLKDPKEYIHASNLSQCQLPATFQVQFVTLQIPPELPPSMYSPRIHPYPFWCNLPSPHLSCQKRSSSLCTTRSPWHPNEKKYQDASIATIENTVPQLQHVLQGQPSS